MANIKSAQKDIIKSKSNALRNKSYKSMLRTAIKRVQQDVEAKNLEAAEKDLKVAISIIDRSRSLHIQKLNTTNRQKARVHRMVNGLKADAAKPAEKTEAEAK